MYPNSMIILWDDEDKIFVVKVPELDGCMTHGKTYAEAVKNGIDAMNGWIEVAKDLGWSLPQPNRSIKDLKVTT